MTLAKWRAMSYSVVMASVLEKTRRQTGKLTVGNLLGVSTVDNLKLAKRVESGLPFEALERVSRITGLSLDRLRVPVRIASRTLTRRRQENKLSPEDPIGLCRFQASVPYLELFEGNAAACSAVVCFIQSSSRRNGPDRAPLN